MAMGIERILVGAMARSSGYWKLVGRIGLFSVTTRWSVRVIGLGFHIANF